MKKISLLFIGLCISLLSFAQENPIKWKYSVNQTGADAELILEANIPPRYHLYSQFVSPGGPLPTVFHFTKSKDYSLVGKAKEIPAPKEKYDKEYEMTIKVLDGKTKFIQKIKVLSEKDFTISGTMDYQVCTDESCFPFNDIDFSFKVKGAPQTDETTAVASTTDTTETIAPADTATATPVLSESQPTQAGTTETSEQGENMWRFILLALLAGFAAVLTPCVFPMIPMTVSFFMQGESKKSAGMLKGLIFTGSITLIYTAIGCIVALTKSADFANVLSTHWISNLIFFVLFVMFAFSFFGLFEITLPSGLSNKMDAKADQGGYLAAFFMAAVLTIVSFSCTGPFVAALLVEAAMGSSALKPILGMMTFGLAMGSPFFILSLSPTLLAKLPKSGGWLNSVKIVFAFILLAFSMKFLMNIDTIYGFNIITREAYLATWIVIFGLMGCYLLGKIKFSHDSDLKHVGVFRLLLVIATFSFVVYLIPGLFGAPLKMISSLIPPESAQQFNIAQGGNTSGSSTGTTVSYDKLCGTPKYADKLHLPHGIQGYYDYEEGLACAKKQNKPVLLDFKGHSCSNCKKMDAEVWSDPRVLALLDQYMVIGLYTDDQTELPENEWVTSVVDGKVKKTMGKRNLDFQITRFKTNELPYYIMLDTDGNALVEKGVTYNSDVEKFIQFLTDGLEKFKAKQ